MTVDKMAVSPERTLPMTSAVVSPEIFAQPKKPSSTRNLWRRTCRSAWPVPHWTYSPGEVPASHAQKKDLKRVA